MWALASAGSAVHQHRGAVDGVVPEVEHGLIGGFERIHDGVDADARLGCLPQEPFAVEPGVGGDAADLALLEQLVRCSRSAECPTGGSRRSPTCRRDRGP